LRDDLRDGRVRAFGSGPERRRGAARRPHEQARAGRVDSDAAVAAPTRRPGAPRRSPRIPTQGTTALSDGTQKSPSLARSTCVGPNWLLENTWAGIGVD